MATRRRARGNQKGKMILFIVEILIIIIMVVVLIVVMNSKAAEGPKLTELDPKRVEIPEEVKQQAEEGGTKIGRAHV